MDHTYTSIPTFKQRLKAKLARGVTTKKKKKKKEKKKKKGVY
jgi:hypothetical protein